MIWVLGMAILVVANAIYCIVKIKEDLSLGRSRLAVLGIVAGLALVPLGWFLFVSAVSQMRF